MVMMMMMMMTVVIPDRGQCVAAVALFSVFDDSVAAVRRIIVYSLRRVV